MEIHYLDIKEKIQLPNERCIMSFPSISAIAALEAILAIAHRAILCDNPTMQELMERVEDEENVPLHLFSAHNIVNTIDRLRLNIYTYNKQTEEYLEKMRNRDLPF